MKHTPYGYKIKNGEIVVDFESAKKVEMLFELYLEDYSLIKAGETVGIKKCHGSISRMLSNKKYIGEFGYPPIISKDIFDKVQIKRAEKAEKLGRNNYTPTVIAKEIHTNFIYLESIEEFDNPFKEAEQKYSLISLEVS